MKGEHGRVVYLKIVPSPELVAFRTELAKRLESVCPSPKSFERREEFVFHVTVAYKLSGDECRRVWTRATGDRPMPATRRWYSALMRLLSRRPDARENRNAGQVPYPYFSLDALRVTLLGDNQRIACEYDLGSKRMLNRDQALDASLWQDTLRAYRIRNGMQVVGKNHDGQAFVISDLHLDHANIIDYCARPFESVADMNETLVENWRHTVGDKRVYYLGDMSFGRGARPATYWLRLLSGDVLYVSGNHESPDCVSAPFRELMYSGQRFLLVHDPNRLPEEYSRWDGWMIHGHTHNNNIKEYPFINGVKKRINVSAELVNYRPVALDYLVGLGLDRIKRMDTVASVPEFWEGQ
jgi:calcineurin-like phosphoesterase family protein